MSVAVFRLLPLLRGSKTGNLIKGCKPEDVFTKIFQNCARQHHITSRKRLYIIKPCNTVDNIFLPLGRVPVVKCGVCNRFSGVRLASTFTVETPGKLQKSGTTESTVSSTTIPPTDPVASPNAILDPIPEPPQIPIEVSEVAEVVGEPTLASLGLGGWSPVGIVQNSLEYLHVDLGIPWWGSIVIGTIVVRTLLFPLVIIAQRNAAHMNNNLPQLQVIQMKMTQARQTGNHLEAARYAQELTAFMKEKDVNPFKNMLVPLAQTPLFISFFMGLRGMANLPVESLMTGGLWWFTDLTMPDQFYLLPLITSGTLYLTVELGTDSAKLSAANMNMMKYLLRALPIAIFPFTVNFPGAILCYWTSSNFISLIQVGFLKIPAVREYFKIDPLVTHKPENLPVKPKGFVKGFQESWANMKITKQLEDRERFDSMQFRKAGIAPLRKTYKYDPTQQNAVSAKKKT